MKYALADNYDDEKELIQKQWPGFEVTCQALDCNSKRILLENSMGYSAESGSWGSVDLVCMDCGYNTTIMES